MERQRFWGIVDGARARSGGDVDQMAVELFDALCALPPHDVVAFHREYAHQHRLLHTHPLWCAGDYALGSMSDDVFADLRTHLIFRGARAVAEVLADPDALAEHLPGDLGELGMAQGLGSAAPDAYQTLTGTDLFETHPELAVADFPDGPPEGDPIGATRRAERLPRIAEWRRENLPWWQRLRGRG